MIYPYTELKYINDAIGYGVFATRFIPKGTIIYCEDPLDQVITPDQLQALPPAYQAIVNRFSYIDHLGNSILCWDNSKYINHCCECNTLRTAYGIDIALRDIRAGEELTDDYGLFNLKEEIVLRCNCQNCRRILRMDDFDRLYPEWDRRIQESLAYLRSVPQPLQPYIYPEAWQAVCDYLDGKTAYRSVLTMKKSQ